METFKFCNRSATAEQLRGWQAFTGFFFSHVVVLANRADLTSSCGVSWRFSFIINSMSFVRFVLYRRVNSPKVVYF